jgi:hypothetical protein
MSETAGDGETAEPSAGLDPVAKVKAKLLEPQCPFCKVHSSDTAADIRGPPDRGENG